MAIGKKILSVDYLQKLAPGIFAQSSRFRTTILLITFINVLFFLRLFFHNSWLPFLLFNLFSIVGLLSYLFYRVSMYLYDRRMKNGPNDSMQIVNEIVQSIKKALEGLVRYQNLGFLLKIYTAAFAMEMMFDLLSPFAFILTMIDIEWVIENCGIPQLKDRVELIKAKWNQFLQVLWVKLPRYNPSTIWGGNSRFPPPPQQPQIAPHPSGLNFTPLVDRMPKQIISQYVPSSQYNTNSAQQNIQHSLSSPNSTNVGYRSSVPQPSFVSQTITPPNVQALFPKQQMNASMSSQSRPQYLPDQSFSSYHTSKGQQDFKTQPVTFTHSIPGVPILQAPPIRPTTHEISYQTISNVNYEEAKGSLSNYQDFSIQQNVADLSFKSIPVRQARQELETLKSPLNVHF